MIRESFMSFNDRVFFLKNKKQLNRKNTGRLFSLVMALALACFFSGQAGAEISFSDMAGRRVDLPRPAKRLVTTFKPATLSVLSLGLGHNLVGVDLGSRKDLFQLAVCPELAKVKGVGDKTGGINLESIVEVKPDLVILYAQKDGMAIADRLENLGIPSMVILPEDFDSIKKTLKLVARAVGRPELAQKVGQAMERVTELVADNLGALAPKDRKVVYYAAPLGFFSTATGTMLQDEMISLAGGDNASGMLKGYFKVISPEQLVSWNPYLIACSSRVAPGLEPNLKRPEIAKLEAVRQKRVFIFPCNLAPWDFPSPLSSLGVLWMAKKLYPQRMNQVDLMAEINRFHLDVYGRSFEQIGGKLADRLN
jgi:iron complex transport system substrate-binding protein